MANIPSPEHPDRWMYEKLDRIEKLLLALNMAFPLDDVMNLSIPGGATRSDILEEVRDALYPSPRRSGSPDRF
jgi:hypothetical protein